MRKDKPSPLGDRRKRRPRSANGHYLAAFVPTPEQRSIVRNLAGIGCTQDEIVYCVPWPSGEEITTETLRKHFRVELSQGKALKHMQLKKRAYDMASEGDKDMLKLILRTQCGWSESMTLQGPTGPDGNPTPLAAPARQVVYYLPRKASAPGIPDGPDDAGADGVPPVNSPGNAKSKAKAA